MAGPKPERMDARKEILVLVAAVDAVALLLGAPTPGRSAPGRKLEVQDAWTRPAALGATDAGYLRIDNRGGRADVLIGVGSPAAAEVSIHESRMAGQVMTMRSLTTLDIPGGRAVTFAPGGLHLMMTGLKRKLRPGDQFPVALIFAKAGRRTVEFVVASAPPGPGAAPTKM